MKHVLLALMCIIGFQAAAGERPTQMTLQLEGVDEYDQKPLKQSIEVLAWSWGSSGPSSGNEDQKANLQDLSLTKYIGLDSPHIMKLITLRKNIKKVTLTIKNANKVVLVLKDARFVSQSMGGSTGEENLTENVTLSFAEIEMQTYYTADGSDKFTKATVPGEEGK